MNIAKRLWKLATMTTEIAVNKESAKIPQGEPKKKAIPQSKYFCGIIDNVKGKKEFSARDIQTAFKFYPKSNHYFFILHDMDKLDDGTPKTKHYHFVMELSAKQTKQGALDALTKSLSQSIGFEVPKEVVTISFCSSVTAYKRYLIHKDENHESGEKFLYDEAQVITNDISSFENALSGIEKGFLTYEQLFSICRGAKYMSEVFKKIGLDNAQKYLGLIKCIFDEKKKIAEDEFLKSRNKMIEQAKDLS
jgi:hypothetical protein